MFQFPGFPSIRYGLAYGCMRCAHAGFPIQTSADQWIFALTYAFRELKQNNYEEIAGEDFDNIQQLFAEILIKGISCQLKQGKKNPPLQIGKNTLHLHLEEEANPSLRIMHLPKKNLL